MTCYIPVMWSFSSRHHSMVIDPEMLARLVFCFENNPERHDGIISGAQDSIGICVPGLVRHYYDNNFWPEKIESTQDEMTLRFLENHLVMIPMEPRRPGSRINSFYFFVLSLFVIGCGLTCLETSANPYTTVLGHPHLCCHIDCGGMQRNLIAHSVFRPVFGREHHVSDYLLAGIEGCGYKDQACLFIAYHDDSGWCGCSSNHGVYCGYYGQYGDCLPYTAGMLWCDWRVCVFESLWLFFGKEIIFSKTYPSFLTVKEGSTFLTKPLFPQGREDVTALLGARNL